MIDDNMTNILKNFASAGSESPVLIDSSTGEKKIINASVEKDAMKVLLERLDAQQSSVNQMPAQHKMAKNTKTKHPASNYLVGGEEGDVPAGEEKLDEVDIEAWEAKQNKVEEVEEAFDPWGETQKYMAKHGERDMKALKAKYGKSRSEKSFDPATTECPSCYGDGKLTHGQVCPQCDGAGEIFEEKFGSRKPQSDVYKKQSFKDIFNSMDEEHENMETRFKRELHDEMQNKALKKGANGKYDLSENTDMLHHELKAIIGNLTYFGDDIKHIQDEFNENNGDTFLVYAKKLVEAVKKIRATKGNA